MKAKQKTELITKAYWACRNPAHRHTREKIAQNCIDKWEGRSFHPKRRWDDALMQEVEDRHAAGESYAAIGRMMSVCGGRISQQMQKWRRIKRRRAAKEDELSEMRELARFHDLSNLGTPPDPR